MTGPEIVGFVNAQRAAHGIPAGITENADWSRGCQLHNHYGAVNGVLEHAEDPTKPGYTAEGDAAGRSSVLYAGHHWTSDNNPFEHAPIHLHQLLAPRIDAMGAYESENRGCASTLRSFRRPAPSANVTYTYPADGTQGWRPSEIASESPYTPGEKLGIPRGTRTGPYLYVMFDGPNTGGRAKVSSASLTGPRGAVDILTVDNTTPGLEGYLPTGAELIPREPLTPFAEHTARISAEVNGAQRTHEWSFTTAGKPNRVFASGYRGDGRTFTFTIQSEAPGGTLTATGPGSPVTAPIAADGTATVTLGPGEWTVCAATGGPGTDYEPGSDCFGPVQAVAAQPPSGGGTAPVVGTRPVTPPGTVGWAPFGATPGTTAVEAGGGGPGFPAKLKVLRASARGGKLDALFSITGRATGNITVDYQAGGRFARYLVALGPAREGEKRITLLRPLNDRQRKLSTGILNVAYAGNAVTQADSLRLRAASGLSRLVREQLSFSGGRLKVAGSINRNVSGTVRLRTTYHASDGSLGTWTGSAVVSRGRWRLADELPPAAASDPNAYLTIQFTGDRTAAGGPYRGEQLGNGLGTL